MLFIIIISETLHVDTEHWDQFGFYCDSKIEPFNSETNDILSVGIWMTLYFNFL
jgi:hypothetical protein